MKNLRKPRETEETSGKGNDKGCMKIRGSHRMMELIDREVRKLKGREEGKSNLKSFEWSKGREAVGKE